MPSGGKGLLFERFSYTNGYSGDSTQLLYLRARMYAPSMGRFLTRDTWSGDVNSPMSFNRWNYVHSNPISFIDPTGHIDEGNEEKIADNIVSNLEANYDVRIKKDWGHLNEFINYPNLYIDPSNTLVNCQWVEGNWRNSKELEYVLEGVEKTVKGIGGPSKFKMAMKNYPVHISRINLDGMASEFVPCLSST